MDKVENNVRVSWVELGEGYSGEYNINDLDDCELLRFDFDELIDGEWEAVDGGSYCTYVPASATAEERTIGLNMIMEKFTDLINNYDHSPRLAAGTCSWIDIHDIRRGKFA